MQDVESERRRRAGAADQAVGCKLGRRLAAVLHALGDREHVALVDLDTPREYEAVAVFPRQCHRLPGRKHRIVGPPFRVAARELAVSGDPAELGEIGAGTALRIQQGDPWAVGLDRFAVVDEREVVDPPAGERDRAAEPRRADLDARRGFERLLAAHRRGVHRRRDVSRWSGRHGPTRRRGPVGDFRHRGLGGDFRLLSGLLRRLLAQRLHVEELESDDDDDREDDRQDEVLLVFRHR